MLTLWTIRNQIEFDKLMKTRSLCTESCYIDEYFKSSYNWMRDKLRQYDQASSFVEYPLWAWYRWRSNQAKPDLNQSGLLAKGTKGVLLTISVPKSKVLLSNFDQWEEVLTNSFVGYDSFEAVTELDKMLANKSDNEIDFLKRESWNVIFSQESIDKAEAVQGVFWKLQLEQVIDYEFFTAQ